MQWCRPEFIAAQDPEGLGVYAGVPLKLFVDDRHDRSFGSDFGQQFAKGARAERVNARDLLAKFEAGDDLGRGRAA